MNYNETEQVINWTQIKRGRLTALASALGFDRRTFHERLNNYRTVSLDVHNVRLQQEIIEAKEKNSIDLLAALKNWLQQRDNRKKALAEALQASNATISKWIKADPEDTILMGWVDEIRKVIPVIEKNERDNYGENRRIANRLVRKYNAAEAHSIPDIVELAEQLLKFSNTEVKTATVFFSKGKIVAAGWAINSLSKNYEPREKNRTQDDTKVSSVELCLQVIENKHKNIDTVVSIGNLDSKDIALLEQANPRVVFHNLKNEKVMNVLTDKNITVCKL
ncbi:hypothetical protein [Acinetobacter colistiniresistens]|uniref:hypothetical protein n=1 Tax=Acinetobacter colistiniresistens TaxID=280145 RepID=UPI001250464F|nr:hypothetical protein [Acinetobacter colistiniresistens]